MRCAAGLPIEGLWPASLGRGEMQDGLPLRGFRLPHGFGARTGQHPKLLILDEPLGQLDLLTRLTMQGELVSLWQRAGFTALLVTHDVEEALFLAGRVIVLSERPAQIKAEIVNSLPYPRHRGDPYLAELRHKVFAHLGLEANW